MTAFVVEAGVITRAERYFFQWMKGRGQEYCYVREWDNRTRRRHIHILNRPGGLSTKEVGRAWQQALDRAAGRPGVKRTHYARPARNPIGLAYYITKCNRKKWPPAPSSFKGRVFSCSRKFLHRPMTKLWKEVLASRYAKRA